MAVPMLVAASLFCLFLALMGYSWARDPDVRAQADQAGWRVAPSDHDIAAEMDDGSFSPSQLRVSIQAIGLAKVRRLTLAGGCVSLIAALAVALLES
ncbi:MAG: hypothetical protein R2746_18705 [Acidimicrobiales bacterium]